MFVVAFQAFRVRSNQSRSEKNALAGSKPLSGETLQRWQQSGSDLDDRGQMVAVLTACMARSPLSSALRLMECCLRAGKSKAGLQRVQQEHSTAAAARAELEMQGAGVMQLQASVGDPSWFIFHLSQAGIIHSALLSLDTWGSFPISHCQGATG